MWSGHFLMQGKKSFSPPALCIHQTLSLVTSLCFQTLKVPFRLKICSASSFSKRQILDSSKLKGFADDNFNCDENGRKLFKRLENTVGKGEIACFEQFLLSPPCFQTDLYCRHVKTQACLGKDSPIPSQ